MDALIWTGAAISLVGIAGLLACMVAVARARGAGLSEADLRDRLKRAVAYNMGALFVSALGLICVILGIILS